MHNVRAVAEKPRKVNLRTRSDHNVVMIGLPGIEVAQHIRRWHLFSLLASAWFNHRQPCQKFMQILGSRMSRHNERQFSILLGKMPCQ